MAKNPIPLAPDIKADRPRYRVLPIISIFVVAPVLAPLFMEAVLLCYGQWCEILGRPVTIRTPMLTALSDRIDSVRQDLCYTISSRFQRVPWNPKVVVPVIALVMLLAMVMLRL